MPYSIDDSTAESIVALEPWTLQRSKEPMTLALAMLIEGEQARRGDPDPRTGALNPLYLTQGTLLKDEYDLSTHAHHAGWTISALIVDVLSMMTFNAAHGFRVGDLLLKGMVDTLSAVFPGARILRLQGDAFAALLTPSSGLSLQDATREQVRTSLAASLGPLLPEGVPPVTFTLAELALTVDSPPNWQILGPLLWAELERAYLLERRGQASGIQRRRHALDGFVPPLETL